jgi:hypothetical protein
MSECTEVFVYEIDPSKVEEFLSVKDKLIIEAETLPGLVASATFRSTAQDNLFMDRMRWEDADAAEAGAGLFPKLPTSERFMSLMAGPPKLGGRFSLVAGA